jgi:hypothetical protein
MNKFCRFGLFLFVGFYFGVPRSIAFACTPPPGGLPYYSVADHVNAALIVLEGVVIATTGPYYPEAANIQVVQYIKGNGPSIVNVRGYGPSSVCLSSVSIGDHLLFYVGSDQNGYYAFYLSQFDAVASADSQTVAEAAAASGQQPVYLSPPGPILTQVALGQGGGPTPTPTPDVAPILTEVYATSNAAVAAYSTDPAGQSVILTQSAATLQALATPSPICGPSPHTIAEHTNAANVVLEGVVSYVDPSVAIVQVAQYLKLQANSFGPSVQIVFVEPTGCLVTLSIGDHYVFYATGEPALPMYPLNFDQYAPIMPPDAATIAEITAASGQAPIPAQSLSGIEEMISLTAAAQLAALTPSATPLPISPGHFPELTQAWATILAASTAYPTDPVGQSVNLTQAYATIESAYTQIAFITATPTPFAPPGFFITPTPYFSPPPNPLLTVEAIAAIGICSAIMLVFGLGLGVAIGITYKQRD